MDDSNEVMKNHFAEKLTKRKNNRLQEFDYSTCTVYFITVCIKNKDKILWSCADRKKNEPVLSDIGRVVQKHIEDLPSFYNNISVDIYTVMPDHLHMLIRVTDTDEINDKADVSTVIRQFKKHVSMEIGKSIWQKSFYDRVIRGPEDYSAYFRYIAENPKKWITEKEFV